MIVVIVKWKTPRKYVIGVVWQAPDTSSERRKNGINTALTALINCSIAVRYLFELPALEVMSLCECGCGEITKTFRGKPYRFVNGHSHRGSHWSEKRRIRQSGINHHWYGKHGPNFGKHLSDVTKSKISIANSGYRKEIVNDRHYRERARKILVSLGKYSCCVVNDSNCNGRLDVHHIDKNPSNNNLNNIVCLCRAHHGIADKYSVPVSELKEVKFVTAWGRRFSQFSKTFNSVTKNQLFSPP